MNQLEIPSRKRLFYRMIIVTAALGMLMFVALAFVSAESRVTIVMLFLSAYFGIIFGIGLGRETYEHAGLVHGYVFSTTENGPYSTRVFEDKAWAVIAGHQQNQENGIKEGPVYICKARDGEPIGSTMTVHHIMKDPANPPRYLHPGCEREKREHPTTPPRK